ncbi:MAG: 8-amino-7-oxononanoate synthase [Paraglaciecola sp.]|nr:8-amino-7-oxononanoate synthase [Paraglaciecola sp.]
MAFEFIVEALLARKQDKLWRKRHSLSPGVGPLIEVDGQHYLNFSSNDYLGFASSQTVAQAWVDGLSEYGSGSGASPLVTGFTQAHLELEAHLAKALKRERVLLFNSGFAANQATFVDGAQSCQATFKRFKHNDTHHLNDIMARASASSNILIATEGVFSMDGDQAPVAELAQIAQDHNAWLMVDDAHGFGVLGNSGLGVVEQHNLSQNQVPVLMATFGKAIGTAGAFVAGSEQLIDYLINFGRHYIYSTSMPAAQAHATLSSIKANENPQKRRLLQTRIAQFKHLADNANIPLMASDTAIQPVIVGNAERALSISEKLKQLGIWATAIRYPTVPKGTDRLRITLSAMHEEQDISALVDALQIAISQTPK